MKISEARGAAEAAGVQIDEPVSLNPDNISEGNAEQIWDRQDLSNISASRL